MFLKKNALQADFNKFEKLHKNTLSKLYHNNNIQLIMNIKDKNTKPIHDKYHAHSMLYIIVAIKEQLLPFIPTYSINLQLQNKE